MRYIVAEPGNGKSIWYIAAPAGWMRTQDGTCKRDHTTNPFKSSPEITENRNHAYLFASHRSAARQAGYLGYGASIIEVES